MVENMFPLNWAEKVPVIILKLHQKWYRDCCFAISNFNFDLENRIIIFIWVNVLFYSISVCSPGLDVPNFFLPGPRVSTSDVVVTAQGEALLQGDNSVISVNLDDGNTDFANYAGPVVMQVH